ncbi:hypothetical protein [Gimesia maris]|uniref:DUF2273 domain-containing protein n=1 Tax=Gimesia maris TaxID=122 RepID=A0ABX5YRG7_9PLAN|nr:hypothetical protein [Gimesia maris]EDL59226.1 hypothetical protein PM8797T_23304 [Gimesia maris DSM 8797]QEG18231.1 hypothetical protein GmarT_41170 [Gimesia maris]QGQ28770.1 hypothetical protein F1729_09005 [Gimesia maris]
MASDGEEAFAIVLGGILLVAAAIIVAALALAGALVIVSVGGIFGGGHALKNYYEALREKLKFERA